MEAPTNGNHDTVMLRMVIGLLLFLCFVLADVSDYRIFDHSTAEIAAGIQTKEDYTNLEKYVMMLLADRSVI